MPLTDWKQRRVVESSEMREDFVSCADTASAAAGVRRTHGRRGRPGQTRDALTLGHARRGYASRCVPLLSPWRRMIFSRLE